MAVLKFLVSAAILGTVAQCQDLYSPYIRSGTSGAQYSPSVLQRGTPRLVPVKVRSSASRLFPSFYYPAYPPPPLPLFSRHQALSHRPYSSSSSTPTKSLHQQPTFPRLHQQYRPAMTGYYRPTRQGFYTSPYRESGQPLAYQTAATASPIVLKRGRVLSASSNSPYAIQSLGSPGASLGLAQYNAQGIPAVSTYRPPPPQAQPQISASPIDHSSLYQQALQQQLQQPHIQSQIQNFPQLQQQIQQQNIQPQLQQQIPQPQLQAAPIPQQQPSYYLQKSPAVLAGPVRPLKALKAKKVLARPVQAQEEEEEYPGDPNPQYNFSFDIKDDELTNYQNRQEERDGQTIKGSYSVVDPDGYVRTVTYTADPKNGFQAKVTREPTDVKIKFPVPTEAPQSEQGLKAAGPGARRPAYASPQAQYQHQPQYQTAAYATPQQVYTSTAGEAGVVQPQFVQRAASRFAIQPQASEPQPRIIARYSRQGQQQQQEQEQ